MKIKFILLFSTALILIAGLFFILYYFNSQGDKCERDPFKFGSKQMEERFGYPFVGWGTFQVDKLAYLPVVSFNSTSTSIRK